MSAFFNSISFENVFFIALSLIVLIIMLIIVVNNTMRMSRLEKKYKMFMKGTDAQSLEKSFERKFNQIDHLYEANEEHDKSINQILKQFNIIFSKYGVEKYDAFDDVGGKLSFALALLDTKNTGIILNAVHSRDNCFLYLKEIFKGESYVMLSQEEVEALRKAVNFGLEKIESEEKNNIGEE